MSAADYRDKSPAAADSAASVVLTDESEPTVQAGPAPMILIIVLGVLVFWAMNYLDQHGGGFNARVYEPFSSLAKIPRDENPAEKGKQIFDKNCAVCHQGNGQGLPGQFPPLAGSEWVVTPGPNRIIRIILNGLGGPIKVKGADYNNVMFPFDDLLPQDEDVAAVATYIRQSWGNKADTVTPEQVKAIRTQVKGHAQWTADELMAIPDK